MHMQGSFDAFVASFDAFVASFRAFVNLFWCVCRDLMVRMQGSVGRYGGIGM